MIEENTIKEYWIGENHFYLGNDNILYAIGVGDIDDEIGKKCGEVALKLQSLVEGRINVLADLNRSGKQSPVARAIWRQLNENTPNSRVAMFGVHPVARVIASFFIGMVRSKGVRFFKRREEALAWLKEE